MLDIDMVFIGLTCIILAWLIQFGSLTKKNQNVNVWFLIIYIIGASLLVIGGMAKNDYMISLLHIASLLAATGVLLKLSK